MDKKTFEHEMGRAKTMQQVEPENQEYWVGYQQGLRRAYHGEKFGAAEEHILWWRAADENDISRQARGKGYRAGFMLGR